MKLYVGTLAFIIWFFSIGCGSNFLVIKVDENWTDKSGQCFCVIDNCYHKKIPTKCVYYNFCTKDQISICINNYVDKI